MNLKYSIQSERNQIDFSVKPDSGQMVIKMNHENEVEISNNEAIELIELLRSKLYSFQETKPFLNRIFK